MGNAWTLKTDKDGIAQLILDVPGQKVNTLSLEVMQELDSKLDSLAQQPSLKALVITSAKKDNFIAGADVKEFTTIPDGASAEKLVVRGQGVLNKIENLPIPTIAVIDGSCMGGGLELALACHYRIVADEDKTSLGLPEVNLGIIPGWGGTQRLTKIVGLMQGLDMILSGKTIPARKASKIGLADAIAARSFLPEEVRKFVSKIQDRKGREAVISRRGPSGLTSLLLEKNPLGRYFVFKKSHQAVLSKTKGFYPAPLAALKVVQETYGAPLQQGLAAEARTFRGLFESDVAKNLIRLFIISQDIKKNPGITLDAQPREIGSVGVLGAGIMGGGIAWLFSKDNHPVRLKDINWQAIGKGLASAQSIYGQLVKIKKMKPAEVKVKMSRISGTTDYSGFKYTDLVVEAVVEDLKIKQQVFRDIEQAISPTTIIASNTSALPISEMAKALQHPERFIGMHFFNPVNRMPLVEVIPGENTSPTTIATCVALLRKLGKTPIVVADKPGFLVNRILMPYLDEAGWLLEQGVDYEKIDTVMLQFGMPMGPFDLLDEVGLDVALKAAKTIEHAFGNRTSVPPILPHIVQEGLLGKKSGGAFYLHKGKHKKRNPKMDHILSKQVHKKNQISNEEIIDRLILTMVNEAAYCLEEKIVSNADALDLAMIMGTGFPAFRGGLLRYADQIGIDTVVVKLQKLKGLYGDRFAPCKLLLDHQQQRRTFT